MAGAEHKRVMGNSQWIRSFVRASLRKSRCGVFLLAGLSFGLVLAKDPLLADKIEAVPDDPLHWSHLKARDCARAMAESRWASQKDFPEEARLEIIRRITMMGHSYQRGYRVLRSSSLFIPTLPPHILRSQRSQPYRPFEIGDEQFRLWRGEGLVVGDLRPHFSPAFQTLAHSNLRFRPTRTDSPLERGRLPLRESLSQSSFFYFAKRAGFDSLSERLHFFSESFIPHDSEAMILVLHGAGAHFSHSGSTLDIARTLAAKPDPLRNDFAGQLHQSLGELHRPISVLSLDLPGAGWGPDIRDHLEIDQSLSFLGREIRRLRQKIETHQMETGREKPIPLIVMARSFSPGLILEWQAKMRDESGLDAFVLISPEHQSPDFDFDQANERSLQIFREGTYRANAMGMHWAIELGHQMRWYERPDPFDQKPTLIFFGGQDPERSEIPIYEWQRRAGLLNSHVQFFDYEEAAHDVFSSRRPETALKAYREFYRLVRDLQ